MSKEPIIEDVRAGKGREVKRRDVVRIKLSMQLSKGEWVLEDQITAFQIGARSVIAGLEKGVLGMKQDGIRKITFGPHLGYRDKPVANIPANAKLICHVELLELFDENDPNGPVGIRRMIREERGKAS